MKRPRQLKSHMGIGMTVGITAAQLDQLTRVLADRVDAETAAGARAALSSCP